MEKEPLAQLCPFIPTTQNNYIITNYTEDINQLQNAGITMILFWKLQIICLNPSFDFNSTLYLEMSINSKFLKKIIKRTGGEISNISH